MVLLKVSHVKCCMAHASAYLANTSLKHGSSPPTSKLVDQWLTMVDPKLYDRSLSELLLIFLDSESCGAAKMKTFLLFAPILYALTLTSADQPQRTLIGPPEMSLEAALGSTRLFRSTVLRPLIFLLKKVRMVIMERRCETFSCSALTFSSHLQLQQSNAS